MVTNKHSKKEDKDLFRAMKAVHGILSITPSRKLPEGWKYEHWPKISYDVIAENLKRRGISNASHLKHMNPSGRPAAIKPDGGLIVAVRRDDNKQLLDFVPLLISESKHQESKQGNAIERTFKNFNALKPLFYLRPIYPYVVFCQGPGVTSEFIKNKLRAGLNSELTENVDINDMVITDGANTMSEKKGCTFVREEPYIQQNICLG